MTLRILLCSAAFFLIPSLALHAREKDTPDSTAVRLIEAGFLNVRSAENGEYRVYTIEADSYKLPVEGFRAARKIIEESVPGDARQVKLIGTYYDVPEVTMTYEPGDDSWSSTKRLDDSWDLVKKVRKSNSNFGKVSIVFYPQVSLMNLTLTKVYTSLWQLSPALEVSLWPGMKFSYQVKIPIVNDGYGNYEDKVHPGMVTLSQRFRDPWNLNVWGKLTLGTFSNNRYGAALELMYYFPNERFSVDTQLGLLANCYYDGFIFKFSRNYYFRWNLAFNYYWPEQDTQFTLRAQRFLLGDYGIKYEMIRHFRRCSVGLYAEKAIGAELNVGFRFQIALPPFRQKRYGYYPKITTSSQMGISYNSNNEQYYYKEFRTEASDNIMSKNYFNPYYLESKLRME